MKPGCRDGGFSLGRVASEQGRPARKGAATPARHVFRATSQPDPISDNTHAGGSLMTRELVAHNKPVFDQLHPAIYGAAVGLVAWFALAAWILFDRQSDIELPLVMVSVLFLVAVLVPWALSLVWKRHGMPHEPPPAKISFRDWRAGDFAAWGSRLHGTHAAIDMLLPLAAVAFGLTAIGIVFLICANAAS
jgi:hypothetical protein